MGKIKGKDFELETVEDIYTWGGEKLDRNIADKLVIGDIVRLMLIFDKDSWSKMYVIITKIDYYKYGGINKPRKFHGKIIDTYLVFPEDKEFIGTKLTFRKENIVEIPEWHENVWRKNKDELSTNEKKLISHIEAKNKEETMMAEIDYERKIMKWKNNKNRTRNLNRD